MIVIIQCLETTYYKDKYYKAGNEYHVDADVAAALGTSVKVTGKLFDDKKEIAKPPKNKMMGKAPKKK